MYGGDFPCPAIHVFTSSATIVDNTVTNNAGDGLRIKGSIVNVQRNTIKLGSLPQISRTLTINTVRNTVQSVTSQATHGPMLAKCTTFQNHV